MLSWAAWVTTSKIWTDFAKKLGLIPDLHRVGPPRQVQRRLQPARVRDRGPGSGRRRRRLGSGFLSFVVLRHFVRWHLVERRSGAKCQETSVWQIYSSSKSTYNLFKQWLTDETAKWFENSTVVGSRRAPLLSKTENVAKEMFFLSKAESSSWVLKFFHSTIFIA